MSNLLCDGRSQCSACLCLLMRNWRKPKESSTSWEKEITENNNKKLNSLTQTQLRFINHDLLPSVRMTPPAQKKQKNIGETLKSLQSKHKIN